jgi:hypothetical protein
MTQTLSMLYVGMVDVLGNEVPKLVKNILVFCGFSMQAFFSFKR